MWEQSGKFEGDIVLTEEQMRNGMVNTARRWRNGVVPFVIDSVFGEYCRTKLQISMVAWREISCIMSTVLDPGNTGG